MHRLVVNPGTPQTWEIQLKEGVNSIGRGTANDFQIEDPSLSTSHCEILVGAEAVRIKDLGSTNGTFVERVPIRDAFVGSGQRVRLGSVEMVLETVASAGNEAEVSTEPVVQLPATAELAIAGFSSASAAVLPQTASAAILNSVVETPRSTAASAGAVETDHPVFCRNHVHNAARHKCTKCQRYFCDLCVNTRGSAAGGLKFCKFCAGECVPVTIKGFIPHAVDFFKAIPRAFKYPFVGDGLILLIGGTLFFGFLDAANYIARNAFQYGMRAMTLRAVIITFILGTGYLFSFLKKVIYSTADGDQQMPDWPELSEWQADIVSPMFQFVVVSTVSFGPAIALALWLQGDSPWAVWLLALLGCFYFPMGMLGVAMFDNLAALNPLFIVGSALKIPKEYAVTALVFAGIIGIRWLSETVLYWLIKVPLVPTLFADLLGLCLLIIEARILGLLYLSQKAYLGWFRK